MLYNNGSIVTGTGNGGNGQNTSVVGFNPTTGAAGSTIGFSAGVGNTVADDFTVPAGQTWSLTGISVLAYQTGTYSFPPISPFTGVTVRIRDLAPSNPLSTVLFSSTTLVGNTFTGTYRTTSTLLTNTNRPVFELQADFGGATLPAGDYWVEYFYSTGFTPPVTVFDSVDNRAELVPGNALQFQVSTGTWINLVDTGASNMQLTAPFTVLGTNVAAVPEPGTWAAAGLCLGGLAWSQRRRLRAAR